MTTVNGQPTAELKGQFKGTVDGAATTFKGSGSAPVKVVDIGSGTDGVAGTGSYQSKVGGVPLSGKNVAFQAAAPPESVANAKSDWTLQLDITSRSDGGKTRTVASADLTLPNGDTIRFPERTVKYSATKGYNLTFKGGTNVTMVPSKADKKSTVVLTGLTFTQQGSDWRPTGGTIEYTYRTDSKFEAETVQLAGFNNLEKFRFSIASTTLASALAMYNSCHRNAASPTPAACPFSVKISSWAPIAFSVSSRSFLSSSSPVTK